LEVNGRYDGSSKFPQDQQFGFFPSLSAGWRLSKESFWHVSPKAISDVKIRASYGSLGNGNIVSYNFLEQLFPSQSSRVLNGQRPQVTSAPAVIPTGLTWETSTTRDLGTDISFLNNRLAFTGDLYTRITTNMFTVGPTLPDVFGATVPKGNYANLKTTGWEFTLTWQDQFTAGSKPFNYGITLNAAHSQAVITKYNNPNKNLSDYYVGEKYGEIWGYETEGYWTADNVSQAAAMNKNISNNSSVWLPGDIKYADLNKDGVISHGNQTVNNPGDMVIIGNETPRYTYGFGVNADWNNFFFAAFFQGRGRTDWYPSPEADAFWGQYNRPYNALLKSQLGNIWTEDNPNAYWPRYRGYVALSGDRELSVPQTKYLQNAAYLRLKNIQFGYNLPQKLISKIRMSNASVYISGENLWVTSPMFKITKHNFDPESIDGSDRVLTNGTNGDAQNYPMLKSITLGLNVTF
jgi:TonB-linked SusC/RagA family outer membrane protein